MKIGDSAKPIKMTIFMPSKLALKMCKRLKYKASYHHDAVLRRGGRGDCYFYSTIYCLFDHSFFLFAHTLCIVHVCSTNFILNK